MAEKSTVLERQQEGKQGRKFNFCTCYTSLLCTCLPFRHHFTIQTKVIPVAWRGSYKANLESSQTSLGSFQCSPKSSQTTFCPYFSHERKNNEIFLRSFSNLENSLISCILEGRTKLPSLSFLPAEIFSPFRSAQITSSLNYFTWQQKGNRQRGRRIKMCLRK